MSASTEKKLRKAAREAGTDKKLNAAREAAEQKAKSRRKWTIGTVAVVLVCAIILFLGSGALYKTTAVTIDGESYSAAETNYFVGAQFQMYANQYGSYASILGLDPSLGVNGLSEQECPLLEGGTWKDYLTDLAVQEMIKVQNLCAYAEENGISLTEEEISQINSSIDQNESYALMMGYGSVEAFYTLNYGSGVNSKIVREMTLRGALANKVIDTYSAEQEYTSAQLEEQYKSYEGQEDMLQYSYYYVAAETETVTNEDGTEATQVVAGGLEAAKAEAEAILAAYEAARTEAGEDYNCAVVFNEVLAAEAEASSTMQLNSVASVSSVYKDWLLGERAYGDAAVIENNENGYYVVVFNSYSDNHYNVAQVRHILVKAVPDENGEYTKAAKAEALSAAEAILAEWKAGEATEDSFAVLATLKSEDTASSANGGLYDGVIKGQMVYEFDKFCFEGHEKGDTAIVYGESSAYAGYHVMYYVGEGEMYSETIAKNDLLNTAIGDWLAAMGEGISPVYGFGLRFVG